MKKNKRIITQGKSAQTSQQRLRIAALLVLGGGLFIGAIFGLLLPAQVTNQDLAFVGGKGTLSVVSYLIQPLKIAGGVQTTFNWFFFLLVFAPCLISSAILFSGAEVCGAVARRTRTRSSSSSTESDGATGL